jgi:S-adenosylmethionine hydrolase
MKVAIAMNQGNFKEKYNLGFGPEWKVEFKK